MNDLERRIRRRIFELLAEYEREQRTLMYIRIDELMMVLGDSELIRHVVNRLRKAE